MKKGFMINHTRAAKTALVVFIACLWVSNINIVEDISSMEYLQNYQYNDFSVEETSQINNNYLLNLGDLENNHQDLVNELIDKFNLDIDEYFFYGMIYTESRFKNNQYSVVGAQGVLQITPTTWDYLYNKIQIEYPELTQNLVNDPMHISTNITLGIFYIKYIQDYYKYDNLNKDIHKILTTYNRGITGTKEYYQLYHTYISNYSEKVLKAAEHIRLYNSWEEDL